MRRVVAIRSSWRLGGGAASSGGGGNAGAALEAMRKLAGEGFGEGVVDDVGMVRAGTEEALAAVTPDAGPPPPGGLLRGIPASEGIAAGPVRHLRAASELPAAPNRPAESRERERERLADALAAARAAVARDRDAVAARASADEAAIFDAHLALLYDDALLEPAQEAIAHGRTADAAAHDAVTALAAVYRGLTDPLLRQRAVDVLDIGRRILSALGTATPSATPPSPTEPAVIVAAELTPTDAAALDPRSVLGIATAHGAPTAHGAILARGLGLPAVVGLGAAALEIPEGSMVLLDGDAGTLLMAQQVARDKLGRVAVLTETIGGSTNVYGYSYDLTGRLVAVALNGAPLTTYTYDANGNRLGYTGPDGSRNGTYDAQDRLTQYGGNVYTYTANGELSTMASKVVGTIKSGKPRAYVAATKPAKSPMTPPPTATTNICRSAFRSTKRS